MVKRELSSDSSASSASVLETPSKTLVIAKQTDSFVSLDGPPKKKARGPNTSKSIKTAWSADEDAILQGILDTVMKTHLWAEVKKDGRLVHRTSYGVQYHAKMLLRQGAKK